MKPSFGLMNKNNCEKCKIGLLSKELNSASCPYYTSKDNTPCDNYTKLQTKLQKEEKENEKI